MFATAYRRKIVPQTLPQTIALNSIIVIYAHYKFVLREHIDFLVLVTVSNFHDIQAYKEDKTIPLYNKGKLTNKTTIIRGECV